VVTAFNLGSRLTSEQFLVCLAGFGVGLSWSSMLMPLGRLNHCEIINFP